MREWGQKLREGKGLGDSNTNLMQHALKAIGAFKFCPNHWWRLLQLI